jgi:hypothetical protein
LAAVKSGLKNGRGERQTKSSAGRGRHLTGCTMA